jgi:biopolymer transport protein ExbD
VKRKHKKGAPQVQDLDVTPFLNLMVVLIPFLLATAVFSQVAIQELNLPQAAAGGATPDKPLITIEVMVRKSSLEIGNGKLITASIPNKDDKHDLETLSLELRELKERYPEKEDINVLIEPHIRYSDVIAVMDAVKIWLPPKSEVAGEPGVAVGIPEGFVLFPEISIGDAP